MMKINEEDRKKAKEDVNKLHMLLVNRADQSAELLDITDVLSQVGKKIDTVDNPSALINRLVNYIRSVAIAGKIHFPDEQEKLMIELSTMGQKAGLNGLYMADFSDKSQFYSYLEKMPRR
ncbi:bacteriocin immunity protein [Pediococcus stilesii]|uniref:Bacteriocin immunity protein n=2 Tax=Pediococcus stilesii TaxID=331679 RepID=A0A0R2KX87_9LACO|nr:bacteriocin immunity protein [Pediococcus stilesii]